MAVTRLAKPAWRGYFEQVSKTLVGKRVEIQVAGLELGIPLAAEWVPLLRIAYDHENDLIEIILEAVHQVILRPREVLVDHEGGRLAGVEILYGDGGRRVVRLREPLTAPPPVSA